ncbi:pirin family protein [Pedobacter sp. PWIIR3]
MENLSSRIFLQELQGSSFLQSENDTFFGLDLFTDHVLAASSVCSFEVPANTCVVIVPVTGALIYSDDSAQIDLEADAGQTVLTCSTSAFKLTLQNPFDEHEINFLLFRIKADVKTPPFREVISFELDQSRNLLNNILPLFELPFKLSMGQFQGRQEAVCPLLDSGIFCFIISGAFEVQGTLLHAKDALAVWNISEAEIEALSNNATILTIELPYI